MTSPSDKINKIELNVKFHRAAKLSNIELIKECLTNGADINCVNKEKNTAAHVAIVRGNDAVLKVLIEGYGTSVYATDEICKSLLRTACNCDNLNALKMLMAYDEGATVIDARKKSPLHYCAERNRPKICKYLLDLKCEVNVRDGLNWTPLHFACYKSHFEIVKLLCRRTDIDVNAIDNEGQTPFFIACTEGVSIDIIKFLIACGCDYNRENAYHRSPLDEACRKGLIEIVAELFAQPKLDQHFSNATRDFLKLYDFIKM